MTSSKLFMIVACVSGALGVILGAFGGHALKTRLPENLFMAFEVGIRYQFYHTFALFVVAFLLQRSEIALLHYAGWGFAAGIALFSGSLYVYALTGIKAMAMITPVGGTLLIAAWVVLLLGVLKS